MKKYIFQIVSIFFPLLVFAHGDMEMESGFLGQLKEFSPLEHFEEGHWFAGVLSLVLWSSFIFAAYSLIKKSRKG